jgi:hypothetical protein
VDTEGLLMHAVVHPADVQERDGGILVLATLFGLFPFPKKLFADGGYQGPKFRAELARLLPELAVEIVKRSDTAQGFCPDAGRRCPRFRARERVEWQRRASNAPSPGSTGVVGWPRISRTGPVTPSHSSGWHPSG